MRTVLFIHGFASSAGSKKAQYFRDRFEEVPDANFLVIDLNPTPLDFEFQTTTGHISRLRQYLLDRDLNAVSIIASSYGGLIAVRYAYVYGGINRMLLLAPGLRWLSGGLNEEQLQQWEQAGAAPVYHEGFEKELPVRFDLQRDGLSYLQVVPPVAPAIVIHGNRDVAVPIQDSRDYARSYPDTITLVEVDADHDLNGHLDLIWRYAEEFILNS